MDARRLTPEQAAVRAEFYRCPYDKVDKIRYTVPGDKLNKPEHLADEYFQAKHPFEWAAYQEDRPQHGGTPLEEVEWIDAGTRLQLQGKSVLSLEMLASVNDGTLGELGFGARMWRERAQQELAAGDSASTPRRRTGKRRASPSRTRASPGWKRLLKRQPPRRIRRGPQRPPNTVRAHGPISMGEAQDDTVVVPHKGAQPV